MSTPLVELVGVHHSFSGPTPVGILEGIDLSLYAGESLAITGVSGSGKSTLLQILGLLMRPSAGLVRHHGQCIAAAQQAQWRNQHIGFVFQHCHLLEELSPLENVLMPAAIARWPESKQASEKRAHALLERMQLGHRASLPCRLLSGGEKQRVAIARAMMNRPALLLADEPSGNLDSRTGLSIQELLLQQPAEGTALCLVTHDLAFASRCSRQCRLENGRLGEATLPSSAW